MSFCPPEIMESRIDRVPLIAQAYDYRMIVLGAWGCGAFRNDPVAVSKLFRKAILEKFLGNFEEIVFAISDWSPDRRFLTPFQHEFETAIALPPHK
ncbi:MAG: TIGR02452 family protein [Chthonomonadaceae bacterium]|nr:TIGR02452 family protein [Chthonomonadaceae bacterium]